MTDQQLAEATHEELNPPAAAQTTDSQTPLHSDSTFRHKRSSISRRAAGSPSSATYAHINARPRWAPPAQTRARQDALGSHGFPAIDPAGAPSPRHVLTNRPFTASTNPALRPHVRFAESLQNAQDLHRLTRLHTHLLLHSQ